MSLKKPTVVMIRNRHRLLRIYQGLEIVYEDPIFRRIMAQEFRLGRDQEVQYLA